MDAHMALEFAKKQALENSDKAYEGMPETELAALLEPLAEVRRLMKGRPDFLVMLKTVLWQYVYKRAKKNYRETEDFFMNVVVRKTREPIGPEA